MGEIKEKITELLSMKKYPKELFYSGNLDLLKRAKISIIGSRNTSKYTREYTYKIASELSKRGVCVVSGGAIGVDAVSHRGASPSNTIAVLPCGINVKYPSINKNLLSQIEKDGLLLSQFKDDFRASKWSFVVRNELVVSLGSALVVMEAEMDSGSMRSIEFALDMKKKIFVIPHRLGESSATAELLRTKKATAIYDINKFVDMFAPKEKTEVKVQDKFLEFCKSNPSYENAVSKFKDRVFEAELNREIEIKDAKIYLV